MRFCVSGSGRIPQKSGSARHRPVFIMCNPAHVQASLKCKIRHKVETVFARVGCARIRLPRSKTATMRRVLIEGLLTMLSGCVFLSQQWSMLHSSLEPVPDSPRRWWRQLVPTPPCSNSPHHSRCLQSPGNASPMCSRKPELCSKGPSFRTVQMYVCGILKVRKVRHRKSRPFK